jgi:hypothetical protein
VHYEATADGFVEGTADFYTDLGASCSDNSTGTQVDISSGVIVSGTGMFADLSTPGDYTVDYACTNAHGDEATAVSRTVYVRDNTCPTCALLGDDNGEFTVEADFPYTDPGAYCSDSLDGELTPTTTVRIEGCTGSGCILSEVDTTTTGRYVITYTVTDSSGNFNGGHCANSAQSNNTRTVVVEDTLKPVIGLSIPKHGGGTHKWHGGEPAEEAVHSTAQAPLYNPASAHFTSNGYSPIRRRLMAEAGGIATWVAASPTPGLLATCAIAMAVAIAGVARRRRPQGAAPLDVTPSATDCV